MELSLDIDPAGRFVCRLAGDGQQATVTASNVNAAEDLLAALEDARDGGYGECFWEEQGGEYRWLFRRAEAGLTVVVLWSTGTLTGWEHVFRATADLDVLAAQVRRDLSREGLSPPV